MLTRLLKISCLLLFVLLVSGCKQSPKSYSFYMRHPDVLQREFEKCQTHESAECQVINQAAHDFYNLSREREENQEAFGKKIIDAEADQSKKHEALLVAQRELTVHPEMRKILDVLEEAYRSQTEKVEALLAVASAGGSPQ